MRGRPSVIGSPRSARSGPAPGAYVDDAFGAVHRAHASVVELPARLPHYAGGLVLREVEVLAAADRSSRQTPYVVILGGSKVSDKLAVIDALLPKVDRLLIGGGMCFTFLAAQGHDVGGSLLEEAMIETCARLLASAGWPDPAADATWSWRPRCRLTRRPPSSPPTPFRPDQKGLDIGPAERRAVRAGAGGRGDGLLERPDGRLRAGAVRRGHPGRRGGGGRPCRAR